MAGPRDGLSEKALAEFFSEAQEMIESFNRDLLLLDQANKKGATDPDLINNVFRAVHTLKGLAGLFGVTRMANLSHNLENLLDDLRLGRIDLSAQILDLLFESIDLFNRILADTKEGRREGGSEVEDLILALDRAAARRQAPTHAAMADYDLDRGLLGVLTEYEEHRLKTNIEQGVGLYRIRARFALASIDQALDDLKAKAKPLGEIITYLPSAESGDEDTIELEILLASSKPIDQLRATIEGPGLTITAVGKRGQAPGVAPEPGREGGGEGEGEDRAGVSFSADSLDAIGMPGEPPKASRPRTVAPPAAGTDVPAPFPGIVRGPGAGSAVSLEHGAPGGEDRTGTLKSIAQTVRVDIRKLDHLMNIVGELAIVRSHMAKLADRVRRRSELREMSIEMHRIQRGFERQLGELQDGILEVRMVPLGQIFDKLARVVRQISREMGKEVNFVISGADTEVDKLIVEELSDPLMHLLRNAIDHGIEEAAVRERAGKPRTGTIALNAFQKGNHVLIDVEDDGAGMDEQRLLHAAIRQSFLSHEEARELTRREILNLVFLPGFSTKEAPSEISGRGVGMDVVKTNIAKLGGVIDIQSELGIGTKFTITLPITLAIIPALVVRVAARTYCLPLSGVLEALRLDPRGVRSVGGREVISLRGATLSLCRLDHLFGLRRPAGTPAPVRPYVVVVGIAQRRVGFVVDELVGQQDIVIKGLGRTLSSVRGFAGATDLGNQQVVLVVDVAAIIEEVLAGAERTAAVAATAGA